MDRWVCKRCFASNDGDLSACGSCGWPRGELARPSEAPVPAHVAPPARPRWWRPILRYWWVGLIAVIGVTGYLSQAHRDSTGSIASGGSVRLSELRVGDCFDAPSQGTLTEVTGRPCTESHAYELIAIARDTVDNSYPDDTRMVDFLTAECAPAFTEYVGSSVQETTLAILPVTPTASSWERGDRTFFCAVYDPQDSRLTGSLRNARR